MKTFNLERALAGDKVVTRNGNKVLEIKKLNNTTSRGFCVVAMFTDDINTFNVDGRFYGNSDSEFDLFMSDEDEVIIFNYYNVYETDNENPNGKYIIGCDVFNTKLEAKLHGKNIQNYVKTIKIKK